MSPFCATDELISLPGLTSPGRGDASSSRLDEHLRATVKRFKKLGIEPGCTVACALPEGPDRVTAALAAKLAEADFLPLPTHASHEQYQAMLLKGDANLLLTHANAHPVRLAAHQLGVPVANVLRHFEAGIFTLEADIAPSRLEHWLVEPPPPAWKKRPLGTPVVLVAPGPSYLRLATRLDATNPVVGITAPSLEHLRLPHTIEHIAAECVRMLRRYRPRGPYALAGWKADSLVALEMARLLEEEGERVVFVAMLDAPALFAGRLWSWMQRKLAPHRDLMAEALRHYRPQPWFGKILHVRSTGTRNRVEWRRIAPQGVVYYEAPSEMLAEPNVQVVATILAAELVRSSLQPHNGAAHPRRD